MIRSAEALRRSDGITKRITSSQTMPNFIQNGIKPLASLGALVENEHEISIRRWKDGDDRPSLLFPVVVVPNDLLWVVEYDRDGIASTPKKVDRCSVYVRRIYKNQLGEDVFSATHLEFLTLDGINSHLFQWLQYPNDFGKGFSSGN